jgi:hypothetical protein
MRISVADRPRPRSNPEACAPPAPSTTTVGLLILMNLFQIVVVDARVWEEINVFSVPASLQPRVSWRRYALRD